MYSFLNFHFLCLPKENETKEKAAGPLGPTFLRDYPALLKITGRCETRLRSDSPRAFPVIFSLLGSVKWQKQIQMSPFVF